MKKLLNVEKAKVTVARPVVKGSEVQVRASVSAAKVQTGTVRVRGLGVGEDEGGKSTAVKCGRGRRL